MSELWQPLLLSLEIAVGATLLSVITAIPLALLMSRRRFVGKSFAEALIVVPMVLPPTVVGYVLILLFGTQGWIGQWLQRTLHYSVMFRVEGAILAAAVVSMPLLYLPAKAAFGAVARDLEDDAKLAGASPWQVFWIVTAPLSRRGLFSGLLLAFARALGEFGATVMVLGWGPDRLTLPISIYADYQSGDFDHAKWAVIALAGTSLLLIVAYNRSSLSVQE